MGAAKPWMKFYPRDWRADEKLRMCSLAARGLWMEMLALMHGSERYGHLLISGNAPTGAQIAVLAGAQANQVTDLLGELEEARVFSRTATGVIYSRRMTDDERKARTARKNGKSGGNPKLCNGKRKSSSDKRLDNQSDKGGDKLRGQRPDSVSDETASSPPDPIKELFDVGVAVLTGTGISESRSRSLIGQWRRQHGDGEVLAALTDCRTKAISNPVEWMPQRLGTGLRLRNFEDVVLEEAGRRATA